VVGSSLARVVVRSLIALFLLLNDATLILGVCCEEWNAVLVLAATNVWFQRNVPDGGCTPLLLLIAFQGSNGAFRQLDTRQGAQGRGHWRTSGRWSRSEDSAVRPLECTVAPLRYRGMDLP
jgi:hypothetical protein